MGQRWSNVEFDFPALPELCQNFPSFISSICLFLSRYVELGLRPLTNRRFTARNVFVEKCKVICVHVPSWKLGECLHFGGYSSSESLIFKLLTTLLCIFAFYIKLTNFIDDVQIISIYNSSMNWPGVDLGNKELLTFWFCLQSLSDWTGQKIHRDDSLVCKVNIPI